MTRGPRWLGACVLAWLLCACGHDPPPGPVTRVEIVTPGGDPPLAPYERLHARVRQGDGPVREIDGVVTAGGFELTLPIADMVTPVRLDVELSGGGRSAIGAPPRFVPLEAGGLVRVPVGAPGSCAAVPDMALGAARLGFGLARHGTFVLLLGGLDAAGPSSAAGFLDLLRLGGGTFDPLPAPVGVLRLAPFSDRLALALPAEGAPFVYDISSADRPLREIALHAGAGTQSALLSLGVDGAVVIGGRTPTGPSADVTWVGPDSVVRRTHLATPRAGPVAVRLGARVLVVGGAAPGEPWAELVASTLETPEPLDVDPLDGVRDAPALVASADASGALLVGGLDGAGAPRADTLLIEGCPPCTARPGPSWDRPRAAPALARIPGGGAWLFGGESGGAPSALVDRVTLDPDPQIQAAASLVTPRVGASALVLPSGLAYVVAGRGPESDAPLAEVEVCFPDSLAIP